MTTLNLDAARAARREVDSEAPKVIFGAREFVLPVELPLAVVMDIKDLAEAQRDEDTSALPAILTSVMEHLLGDEFDAFMALRPSMDDFAALIDGVMPMYGGDVGESAASES